jgi:uncharacterized protein YjbI with pentapeptide repeats
MTTGPRSGEHDSDTSDVAGKEPPTPSAADTNPEAGSESSPDLSKNPIVEPKRWRDTLKRLGTWLSNPPWWFSNGLVALFISIVVFIAQVWADNRRDDQSKDFQKFLAQQGQTVQQAQARHAEQLEDLRFVRDRSSLQYVSRPFSHFDLEGQDVSTLQLQAADFYDANLASADLSDTDLSIVDLGSPPDDRYRRALLARAVLSNADLVDANLIAADATDANLNNADLTKSILCAVSFQGANLHKANLTQANLSGTEDDDWQRYGYDIHFRGLPADLSNADLSGANLTDANLSGANLTDANLAGTILTNIFYDASTKWPSGFRPPPSRPKP